MSAAPLHSAPPQTNFMQFPCLALWRDEWLTLRVVNRMSAFSSACALGFACCKACVNHRHDLGPFPDCGRNTLYVACPHVTNRKYAASARFEGPPVSVKFGASQDKASLVQSNARSRQPICIRIRADEQEQMSNGSADLLV